MNGKWLIVLLILNFNSAISINALLQNSKLHNKNNRIDDLDTSYKCRENKSSPWCISTDYNKEHEPWEYRYLTNTSLPWKYYFNFNILEVQEVSDMMQTVTIAMYLRIKWKEPRMKIENNHMDWTKSDRKGGGLSYHPEIMETFWTPDLEILGLKIFDTKHILKEMSGVEVFKSQHIKYNARVEITFSCKMYFDRYPLDSHSCPFRIGSFFSTDSIVNCKSNFSLENESQRSLQHLIDFEPLSVEERCSGVLGNQFALCGFTISLHRTRVQIFFQVYLISFVFVIVSWVSFLIKPENVAGRMGLLVTIFLVLINIFNAAKSTAPVSLSLNAVDLYLVCCIGQVFFALLEYVVILSKWKFQGMCQSQIEASSANNKISNAWSDTYSFKQDTDTISIITFPLLFILFNIIYWSVFF
jgi:hypothetical protein